MRRRQRRDDLGQPAGGDHRGVAELVDDPPAHAVDLRGVPVERAGLDRLDRRLPDDAAGLDQLDAPQRGGVVEQRVHGDGDARERWRRPRYSPSAEMASKVVAVPRSTTMHGPAVEVVGADGVGDAVGARPPWGCRRGWACPSARRARARRRARRTTGSAIWRSAVVTRGTDDVTAMPVTTSSTSMPSRLSSCDSNRACSSGVRSATVDNRQWWVRPAGSGGTGGAGRLPAGGRRRGRARTGR